MPGAHRRDRESRFRKNKPEQTRLQELGQMSRIDLLGILTGLDHKNMPNKDKYASMSRDQMIAAILRLEGR